MGIPLFSKPAERKPRHPQKPLPPPLPEPRRIQIQHKAILTYVDVRPADYDASSTPTLVLLHGGPGRYQDFRYLIPLLQESVRAVTLNLPGFHDSEVIDKENRYAHMTAKGVTEIAYEALTQICGDAKHVFLVGHSFGGHATTNLAALNLSEAKLNVRGVGFLASTGHTPHRTLWPSVIAILASLVRSSVPFISSVGQVLSHQAFTKFVGFPDDEPASHFVASVIRSNTTSYDLVNQQRREIAHIPAFMAWAKDDPHIEVAISNRLSEESHPGPRFAFDKGGHNIQKTQADFLAIELVRWSNELAASATASSSSSDLRSAL